MPMTCRTCRHPQREAIDKALVAGETTSAIAGKFGLARSGVERHFRLHLKPAIAAKSAKLDRHVGSIVGHLSVLLDKALEILESPDDQRTALQAVREARGVIETMGHASGELVPVQVQQVYVSLGVSDESELRRIIAQHKAASSLTLDDAERDAVSALKLVFEERPERRVAVLAELSSEAREEGADEVAVREPD